MSSWWGHIFAGAAPAPAEDDQAVVEPASSWYVPSDDRDRWKSAVGQLPPMRLINYRASDGDLVLRLCEDATGLLIGPTDRRLLALGIFSAKLRGERYRAAACRAGDFTPGTMLALRREPDNPHDRNAVGVTSATSTDVAGYVNKQKAAALAKRLDAGWKPSVVSTRGTRPGVPCDAISVIIAEPEVVRHLLMSRPAGAPPPAHLR